MIRVIGYGNPGRGDDGSGIRLAEEIEAINISGVTVDIDYQLNIEHASDIAGSDLVIFIDASENGTEPYEFNRLTPSSKTTSFTHSVDPQTILGICQDVYKRVPETYLLAVRGYSFDFHEGLTDEAARNLTMASEFLQGFLNEYAGSRYP